MYDEEEALLIARYLIESNNEGTYLLDMNQTCDVNAVKKLLRKLLGQYEIVDPVTERGLIAELGEVELLYVPRSLSLSNTLDHPCS